MYNRKSVLTAILIAVSLPLSTALGQGSAGAKGGDIFETRFQLAIKRAKEAIETGHGAFAGDPERKQWLRALETSKVKRSETEALRDETGTEKAIVAVIPQDANEPATFWLSVPYFEKYRVTPDEAFVLVVHEAGHVVDREKTAAAARTHAALDAIGREFLAAVTGAELQRNVLMSPSPKEELYKLFVDRNLSSMPTFTEVKGQWEGRCWDQLAPGEPALLPTRSVLMVSEQGPGAGPLFPGTQPPVYGWQIMLAEDAWNYYLSTYGTFRVSFLNDHKLLHIGDVVLQDDLRNEALAVPSILGPWAQCGNSADCRQDFAIRKFGDTLITVRYSAGALGYPPRPGANSEVTSEHEICYYFAKFTHGL